MSELCYEKARIFGAFMPVILVLEMMRQEDPWDLLAWADCLAQSVSSRFSEKPLSQNKKEKKERDR